MAPKRKSHRQNQTKNQDTCKPKKPQFEDDEEIRHKISSPDSTSDDACKPPPVEGSSLDSDSEEIQNTDDPDFIGKPKPKPVVEPSSNANKVSRGIKKRKLDSNGDEDKEEGGPAERKRAWSEDEEIALLKGIVDYKSKSRDDPNSDIPDILEYLKGFLHFDVQRRQLNDKLRRLKNKYRNSGFVVSTAHELELFELSKKIWGGGNAVDKISTRKDKKRAKVVADNEMPNSMQKVEEDTVAREAIRNEIKDVNLMYPQLSQALESETSVYLSSPNGVKNHVNKIIGSMGMTKANELEGMWTDLRLLECEVEAKKLKLMKERKKLVLGGMKDSSLNLG